MAAKLSLSSHNSQQYTNRNKPFLGFQTGREMANVLALFHNKDLLTFAQKIFTQVSTANVKGDVIPWTKPVVAYRGVLQRRTAKLLNMLSLTSNAILQRRPWLPQNCQQQHKGYSTYVEERYCQYKSTPPKHAADGFIASFPESCAQTLKLNQGGDTLELFFEHAREYYKARELALKALDYGV